MLSPESAFSGKPKRRKARLDSKGRISIPSDIRKSFGLEKGAEITLVFDLRRNYLILVIIPEEVRL